VTEKLVNSILTEVPKLVLDYDNGAKVGAIGGKCGKFELIYSE
jgi:hypothetical protein